MSRLFIHGGHSATGEPLELAIEDGVIAELGPSVAGLAGAEVIDASGLLVLPGAVDTHVHFNAPGSRTHWEGWESGSAAAAAGGITTVVEMPLNANPPTVDAGAFAAKAAAAGALSRVDFGLWGGVIPGNRRELPGLADAGVIGFKAFMSRSGTPDFPASDDLTLYEAMGTIAELGLPFLLHAESDRITADLAERAVAAGTVGVRDYLDARPPVAESEAIARALELAAVTGCRLHIVHVSTRRGVELVQAARARGQDVTCEITAHHLVLSEEDALSLGAVAKCAPPLRVAAELDGLWDLLAGDETLFVISDHSPSPLELKSGPDFFAVWGGIAGIQSTVEVIVSEVLGSEVLGSEGAGSGPAGSEGAGSGLAGSEGAGPGLAGSEGAGSHRAGAGRAAATILPRVLAGAAAARFGLPGKGELAPGMDADITLVDVGHARVLAREELLDRHRHSPYVGRELTARVRTTLLRGVPVYHNGAVVGVPRGRLLTPSSR